MSEYQAELSKENGKKIIDALNKYRSTNNLYPENLSMLTPEYLESIPNSMMGWLDEPFEYMKRSDGSFDIYFPGYTGTIYKSSNYSNGNWIETD